MNDTLFRKSSMDRLKSPEQLNDYIRVANPGVWLVLGAIILLLVGIVIWGVFGTVYLGELLLILRSVNGDNARGQSLVHFFICADQNDLICVGVKASR